jgi:hypothetical protein
MAVLKSNILGDIQGSLGGMTFTRAPGRYILKSNTRGRSRQQPELSSQQAKFRNAIAEWRALSAESKKAYYSAARALQKNLTGYNYFILSYFKRVQPMPYTFELHCDRTTIVPVQLLQLSISPIELLSIPESNDCIILSCSIKGESSGGWDGSLFVGSVGNSSEEYSMFFEALDVQPALRSVIPSSFFTSEYEHIKLWTPAPLAGGTGSGSIFIDLTYILLFPES